MAFKVVKSARDFWVEELRNGHRGCRNLRRPTGLKGPKGPRGLRRPMGTVDIRF